MKRVFLDLGNTRFKWADDRLNLLGARAYPAERPAGAIAETLAPVSVEARLVIASVRNEGFNRALADELAKRGLKSEFLRTATLPGFRPAYRRVEEFGVDRALNLIGAARDYPAPLLVASAGTAVTFDLLDSAGAHLGGCIFPGLGLLRRSLTRAADGIASVDVEGSLLADGTAAGAAGGVMEGYLSAVAGIIGEMVDKTPGNVTILLTGGDAPLIHAHLPLPSRVDSLLLFKGMDIVSQRRA